MSLLALILATLMQATPTEGETARDVEPEIMAALTQETVEIRSDFSGANFILYGAARGVEPGDDRAFAPVGTGY